MQSKSNRVVDVTYQLFIQSNTLLFFFVIQYYFVALCKASHVYLLLLLMFTFC